MTVEYPKQQQATLIGAVIAAALLVVGLVAGVVLLFSASDDNTANTTATPECAVASFKPGEKLRSSSVRVNVFNGSSRNGLAGETLEALAKRGFLRGDTANASSELVVKRVKVYATPAEAAAGRLVAQQFGPRTDIKPGPDLAPGIDIVLGPEFQGLTKAPAQIALSAPTRVCASGEEAPQDEAGSSGEPGRTPEAG